MSLGCASPPSPSPPHPRRHQQLRQLICLTQLPDPENYSAKIRYLSNFFPDSVVNFPTLLQAWESQYPELTMSVRHPEDLSKIQDAFIREGKRQILFQEQPWLVSTKGLTGPIPEIDPSLLYHIGTPEFNHEMYLGKPYSLKIQCLMSIPGGVAAIEKHYGLQVTDHKKTMLMHYNTKYFTRESYQHFASYRNYELFALAGQSGCYDDFVELYRSGEFGIKETYINLAKYGDQNLITRFHREEVPGQDLKPKWIAYGAAAGGCTGLLLEYLGHQMVADTYFSRLASSAAWHKHTDTLITIIEFCYQRGTPLTPSIGEDNLCLYIGSYLELDMIQKVNFSRSPALENVLSGVLYANRLDVIEALKDEIMIAISRDRHLTFFSRAVRYSCIKILDIYIETRFANINDFRRLIRIAPLDDISCQGVKRLLDVMDIDLYSCQGELSDMLERVLRSKHYDLFTTMVTHPKLRPFTQGLWVNSDDIHSKDTIGYVETKKLILDNGFHTLSPKYEELIDAIKRYSEYMVVVIVNHILKLGKNMTARNFETLRKFTQSKVDMHRQLGGGGIGDSVDSYSHLPKIENILAKILELQILVP